MPSGGRLESGALVRMIIQWLSSHGFAGKVKNPLKVAPDCSKIVSPQLAAFSAFCKLPPALTVIMLPGAGVSVIAV